MNAWAGQFEDAEEIDVLQLQYVLKKHRRQKYKCTCGHVETALGPKKLIRGGRYSTDFAVHTAVSMHVDHLPLERQRKQMKRAGLTVTTQTLWDQKWALSLLLEPTKERLHRHLLQQEVVLADETRWPLLGAKGRASKNWYIWALAHQDGVVYQIQNTRSNEAGKNLLDGFSGVVVSDGYIVYQSLSKSQGFVLAHDWSHARRKFFEAEDTAPDLSNPILDDIGKLFLVEREIAERVKILDPIAANDLRAQVRDEQSKPIVERIGERASTIKALRESPIAKAVVYLENRWHGLLVYLKDPRVPITSNAVEGALRGPVLGRKNALGSRSERGIRSASVLYSLTESAKYCGIDPANYLSIAAHAALDDKAVPLPHELQ